MKKFIFVLFAMLCAVFLTAFVPAHVVRADVPPVPWLDVLVALIAQFPTLPGVALLVSALLNVLKLIPGLVTDGTADTWKNYLSLAAFVVLAAFGIFKPDFTPLGLDAIANQIATILAYLTGFFVVAGFTGIAHRNALRGLFVVGTSYSLKKK